MELLEAHPLFAAAIAALIVVLAGWRVSRAAIRRLRAIIVALWPH